MRNLKNHIRYVPFVVILLGIVSCTIINPSYKTVYIYDLSKAEHIPIKNVLILVEPFSNDSPSGNRMLYRKTGNQVIRDDYNRWAQAPAALVTKYVTTALSSDKQLNQQPQQQLIITGTVLDFEIDLEKKETVFQVEYQIREGKSGKLLIQRTEYFREKFSHDTPSDFARGMSNSLQTFSNKLSHNIYEIIKK